jgi:beta-phosphoglucomutase-like phosphatase (HAD superfamily)
MIRAFLFDLDGVLTDTSEFHYLGWKRLADELGVSFGREENEALRGRLAARVAVNPSPGPASKRRANGRLDGTEKPVLR